MKMFVDLTLTYFSVSFVLVFLCEDCSSQSFLYEKMHNFGLGNRVIPNYRRFLNHKEHPEPLPSSTHSPEVLRSPYKNLYQGSRRPNDTRVYRKRFDYEATPTGQHVFCKGMFDCIITHLAVETQSGIPIILRGGAGYHHFVVVAKAKPGDELKGLVRAYCMQKNDEYFMDRTTPPPKNHRFQK
ncbi:hypothetical protein ABMA27_015639 [Loxostege sticticalis]|uniref:Uncharacterized protein n=1 Tax=Loxostege sticticalis TaxID=481309 RepID=A0ABR3I8H1_LOXSC